MKLATSYKILLIVLFLAAITACPRTRALPFRRVLIAATEILKKLDTDIVRALASGPANAVGNTMPCRQQRTEDAATQLPWSS